MIVLTVGKSYIDIDGYASSLAYRELLKLQGIEAKFVSNAKLNYSITNSLINLSYHTDNYDVKDDDNFIILDLSDKDYFPDFVKEKNIIELIDHHPGYEEYWNLLLGNNSVIEKIGSVATIIVEKYKKSNLLNKMSIDIAKLLMAAILDNTLNFISNMTTERDKIAYKELEKIIKDYNFSKKYFNECQNTIENMLEESINNDIKNIKDNKYIPKIFGQLTIFDINKILKRKEDIIKIMNNYGNEWIINIISLNDNMSYIICSTEKIKNNLNKLFNSNNIDNIIIVKPALLRKEIIKLSLLD